MKIFAFALLFLQLAMVIDLGAAQCAAGWFDRGGQCMQCSSSISGEPSTGTNFLAARNTCKRIGGNLATITTSDQENFAAGCSGTPWIGYTDRPTPAFLDGTNFEPFGTTPTHVGTNDPDCFVLTAVGTWTEESTNCDGPETFVCSRPYDTCYDLEVSGTMSVAYTHNDTSTDGKKWVGTVATYSCSGGYNVSGTSTRTCNSDGSWTGSAPTCVLAAVCSAVTGPTDSTISYSAAAVGASYTTGTVATQVCNTDYDKTSGTDSRTCESSGAWTGSDIVCEKEDNNDNLAIGLGLGLGVPGALAMAALLYWMCRRPTALPRLAPAPRPVAYPRPVFRPPYPRRMGPRPFF